jgi:hypothetical protein
MHMHMHGGDIYRGGSCCVAGDARWILRFVDWVVFGFRETLRELRYVGRRGEVLSWVLGDFSLGLDNWRCRLWCRRHSGPHR